MNEKMRVNELKEEFKERTFTTDEFYEFYTKKEAELKKTTFRSRVHYLKNKGIIYSPKRGLFVIGIKKTFDPIINENISILYKKIRKKFPYSDVCIWETNWLHNYMVHQVISSNIIIEIDKEAASVAFAFLQEDLSNVYLNPSNVEMERYINNGGNNIIIKNLVSDSPIEYSSDIAIPKVEKIMVDLFVDDKIFVTYQGEELSNIYRAIFKSVDINQSTLQRYATRRSVYNKLVKFIKEEVKINDNKLYLKELL